MAPVKAVLFDYGMVLAPPDPAAWQRMRTITGLSEDILHREYWAHRRPYDRGDLKGYAFWNKVAEGAGISLSPTQLADLTDADTDLWGLLNEPMLEWVRHLQQSGIRTGILSNMPDAMETGLRARHAWIETFDHCTWSHSVNLAKPEPAIYQCAAEGLQTPPANILFLDDKSENIHAAHEAGMQAILYTDHPSFLDEMHIRNLDYLLQPSTNSHSQNGKL